MGLMSQVECANLKRAEQIAREKGLLARGKSLNCSYGNACDGLKCPLVSEPQTRIIWIPQTGKVELPKPIDTFYAKLEAHEELKESRTH